MRNILIFSIIVFLTSSDCNAQHSPIHIRLADVYQQYKEPSITHRRFKHDDIKPLILRLKPPYEVDKAGESIEGRSIFQVKLGNGPVKVLLWSQMHGDEPSATMAIMDIFNFFSASDSFDPFRKNILDNLTLYFLPMLNPDGAEVYRRRNALGIDINRDAVRLVTPEAQVLKRVRDELNADWGFNLHDQGRHYGAGKNPHTATISFLAPAYNYEKGVNETRGKAMDLIVLMNEMLQNYIPGKVGRYNDDFEPRAFGDNIQKWGTSTILIESGGLNGDPEKQDIRKLNFLALMTAFEAIADDAYQNVNRSDYERIPFNASGHFKDLIIRDTEVEVNGKWFTVDIGINRREAWAPAPRRFAYRGTIIDMGDLSVYSGYRELSGKGYRAVPGKVYQKSFANTGALKRLDFVKLLQQGYTDIQVMDDPNGYRYDQLPVKILLQSEKTDTDILPSHNPSLLLKKGDQVRYAIINGFVYDLENDLEELRAMGRKVK